ncbi:hypothetical protein QNH46_24260 [Paenibacillus woosongensis]|uniref:Uncharacterized protein n=1 Tax=Paenibacillus woosongensis TaxID=307580 RepID=A0AA95IAS1_9BACL|nr:hypothetical protein [Paenibacillus woosongensis]WHX49115.1 hypothetical protein QNH46_24260 [Paenibacillus woosongensis]
MTHMTNDELRVDIAALTECLRQIRIEKGLPPDPPERKQRVEMPLSLALVERLQPFRAIAVKYASIIAAGQVTRIDTDRLAEYAELARLLSHSVGFFSGIHALGARAALDIMNHINELIDAGKSDEINISDEMRKLHIYIGFMTKDDGLGHDLFDQGGKHDMDARKEAERLISDPAALQAAIDAANKIIEEDVIYE